jgi:hypothetical protein
MEVDGGFTGDDVPSELLKFFLKKVISVRIQGSEVCSFTYS